MQTVQVILGGCRSDPPGGRRRRTAYLRDHRHGQTTHSVSKYVYIH